MEQTIRYEALFDRPGDEVVTDCICTTMSMSNDEMLRILGSYCKLKEIKSSNIGSILDRCKDKFRFYYDARKTNMKSLVSYNDQSVTAAVLKMQRPAPANYDVFHPKIVLVRIQSQSKENEYSYRLQVSSRNLTSGTDTFETGVQLESVPCDTKNHNLDDLLDYLKPNKELLVDEFFKYFDTASKSYLNKFIKYKEEIINSPELTKKLSAFIETIEDVNQNRKSSNKIVIVGEKKITGAKRYLEKLRPLLEDWNKLDRMSQELKKLSFVIPCMPDAGTEIIVSGINDKTQHELWDILKNEEKALHILSPDYETGQDMIRSHNVYAPKPAATQKTHAKLYYYPEKDTLWLGSCNLSEAAMTGKNVECMVKVTNVGGAVTFDNNVFTVFGTECERIQIAKPYEGGSDYGLYEKLADFLEKTEFSGKDHIATFRFCSIKVDSKFENENVEISFLPLGFDRNINWQKWDNKESGHYTFKAGASNNPTNGMLRVMLTETDNNNVKRYAETVVVFDWQLHNNMTRSAYTFLDFQKIRWLQQLMDCEDPDDAQNRRAYFLECCNRVSEAATDIQKITIKDSQTIYEACYEQLFPKGGNV